MARLKLKLAQPLSEARKTNPRLDEAALFVEGLFGRPLRNDPKTLHASLFPIMPFVSNGGGVFNPGLRNFDTVHELTHSEDLAYLKEFKGLKKFLNVLNIYFNISKKIYLEGRAVFASHIFRDKIRRFELYFTSLLIGTYGAAANIFNQTMLLPKWIWVPFLFFGVIYWPFHNALCMLAKKLDDPVAAFRLSTEKPPSLFGIFFPSIFYRKEIEAAQGKEG